MGIDACSPGEVLRALECGWRADEISYTGTNVSERDLDVLLAHDIHVNLDAISQIRRYGRRAPGRTIGLRIDPGAGAGYRAHLEYSGRPTKFGIGLDRLEEALAVAREHDLTIDTVHFHAGSGWLGDGLAAFEAALARAVEATAWLIAAGCPIGEVNVGGGIGVPARDDEPAVDLDAYAALLARHLGPLGVVVGAEPGDYLSKDAAILLGEVVTVEERGGVTFVGLDLGWNLNCAYFIYGYLQEILPVAAVDAPRTEVVTVAGPHQRGERRVRRGLPDGAGRRGRHRRPAQRRWLPPGDELDPLPSPAGGRDLPGSLRSPQLRTRSIAIRISGRVSRS